jgi:hypothetical protein
LTPEVLADAEVFWEGRTMSDDTDWIARTALDFLIEDAKLNFRGERQEMFVWAIYNAVRNTHPAQLQNLRELIRKYEPN